MRAAALALEPGHRLAGEAPNEAQSDEALQVLGRFEAVAVGKGDGHDLDVKDLHRGEIDREVESILVQHGVGPVGLQVRVAQVRPYTEGLAFVPEPNRLVTLDALRRKVEAQASHLQWMPSRTQATGRELSRVVLRRVTPPAAWIAR